MSLLVTDLTKKYGDRVVLDHLSFSMSSPGVYALLGTGVLRLRQHQLWRIVSRVGHSGAGCCRTGDFLRTRLQ